MAAWVSYLNVAVLVGTLSLALFNASKDEVAKNMAYAYAVISVGTLVRTLPGLCFQVSTQPGILNTQIYGYAVYQRRITMIRKRDPGHFGSSLALLN